MMRRFPLLLAVCVLVPFAAGCGDSSTGSSCDTCAAAAFDTTLAVSTQTVFQLRGINGTVTLTGKPGLEHVEVSGVRWVRSHSRADAEAHLDSVQVEILVLDHLIQVRTDQPSRSDGRTYTVDYEVEVPADLRAELVLINGNIHASDAAGGFSAATVNGNVTCEDIRGGVVARAVNGNLTVAAYVAGAELVRMEATNGNLSLEIPDDTSALVSASVTTGTIVYTGLDFEDLVETSLSLAGRLGTGEGRIRMTTVNGTVRLRGVDGL